LPPERSYTAAEAQVADKSVADLVNTISEQASVLVREEIELAKAEVQIKARKLGVGAGIGAAAGFFVFLALIYLFEGLAWFLNDQVFNNLWTGFLVVMALLLVLAAIAGFIASRLLRAGAPPVPEQAIEQARLTREALEHPGALPPPAPSGTTGNNSG
jgi:uncharacterized membrane protein YqjE